MYIHVEPNGEFIPREAGTLFLYWTKSWYLYMIVGITKAGGIIAYLINPVKGIEKEVDDISLKTAIQMADKVLDEKINRNDLDKWIKFSKNAVNVDASVDKNKVKAWYLKNKMLNLIEDVSFEDNSELKRVGTIHTEDLEVGLPYMSRDGNIYVYLGKRNGYYNFYQEQPWYLESCLTLAYFANKKYKKLPQLYKLNKLSDEVITEIAKLNTKSYLAIKQKKFGIVEKR